MFCPYCGAMLNDDATICTACNAPLEDLKKAMTPASIPQQEAEIIVEQAPVCQQETEAECAPEEIPAKKRSRLPKILLICGIVLVLLAGLAGAAYHFVLPKFLNKGPGTALYIKDNELFTTRLSKLQPWQVTSNLLNADKSTVEEYQYRLTSLMNRYAFLSEDGKTVFFPDKVDPTDYKSGATIYYRKVTDPVDTAKKLDDDISRYTISADGQRVIYQKTDGSLYRYNMTEKVKIDSDVGTFYASEDCKHVIYCVDNEIEDNPSETVYAQTEGQDKQKLTSHSTGIQYINNKCSTIYYLNEDNTLYKACTDGEKIEIATDVLQVIRAYESGELYYTTRDPDSKKTKLPAKQFLTDDVSNDTSKDALRQEINNTELSANYVDSICYYNGKESLELANNCYFSVGTGSASYLNRQTALDSPVLSFFCYDIDKITKVKLSQIDSVEDLEEQVPTNAKKVKTYFLAVKGSVTELDIDEQFSGIQLNEDGSAGYYWVDDNPDDRKLSGTLYELPIKNGAPQAPYVYDTEVSEEPLLEGELVIYQKNVSDTNKTYDLYVNQALVDYDVGRLLAYDFDNKILCYMTDWSSKDYRGTLKLWKNGNTCTIASDVYTCEIVGEEILYLSDYNKAKGYGTLHRFKNGNSELVDDDVSYIIDDKESFGLTYRDMYYETTLVR